MPPELWFAPNIGSVDLLDLFRRPEQWATARAQIRTLQLYAQHIQYDAGDPAAENGPNYWSSLCDADAWRRLAGWPLNLSVEIGAVKWAPRPEGCTAQDNENTALSLIAKVAAAGGRVGAIAIDEALVSGLDAKEKGGCGLSLADTVANTARFIRNIRTPTESKVDIGVIEAYPHNDVATILAFMDGLHTPEANASPNFLHLDVDRYGIRDKNLSPDKVAQDLRLLQSKCHGWGIPLGVILFGQRPQNAADFCHDVHRWAQRLRGALGGWPDRLIFQSWEEFPKGRKVLPPNLPDTDPNSHTGLVRAVQAEMAATTA
jgi:hypothetical protein